MLFQLKTLWPAIVLLTSIGTTIEARCTRGCDLALGSYYVWPQTNLTFISEVLDSTIPNILSYNPQVPNQDSVQSDIRISVPFSCDCINGEFLGHVFGYDVRSGDTYEQVATTYYANLTTTSWLERFNSYDANRIPDTNARLNVTVNCSCGDARVSKAYGLFVTYPLLPGESLDSISAGLNLSADLLQSYNPGSNFSAGSGLVYIPGKDQNGNYPPLKTSTGCLLFSFTSADVGFLQSEKRLSNGVIAAISVAGVAGLLLLAGCLYVGFYRKKKVQEVVSLLTATEDQSLPGARDVQCDKHAEPENGVYSILAPLGTSVKATDSPRVAASPRLTGITIDKSVEFSYEELAKATNDFSIAYKIGQGGFGAVYYAELRGERAAIKKMDMQASREFLAELKVLTHVHHLNLVRLIGYCVEGSLFLVYEFIENGNLSQHLRGTEKDPLPWSTRVQIALDSARGLEYIHEHTVPVYIHRDIKSANILIDKNFHGKVADFGLTKLTEVGSTSMPTRLVGTFGYMPPEYAQYGDVSPKVDVYAFGVVLYELISAKEAIVKADGSVAESKGLVAMVSFLSFLV
ncbi:hypothetical protein RJ640_026091, partial [Escallonia rubra]